MELGEEWREDIAQRNRTSKTSRLYRNGKPTRICAWDGSLGSMHYRDGIGDWQEVDTQLLISSEPNWDWEMFRSHWRLFVRNNGWIGIERGGVGFGFRLLGWTFLNIATKEYEDIREINYSTPIVSGNELKWLGIYPGVDYRLVIGSDGMGYVITIAQATRDNIPASPYSPDDTFFIFAYQVRWNGCPYTADVESEAWWKRRNESLEPSKGLWLADVAGKVKAWLPLGWGLSVGRREPIELRQRYVEQEGSHYLLSGARWNMLKELPEGDIVLSSNIDLGFFGPQEI